MYSNERSTVVGDFQTNSSGDVTDCDEYSHMSKEIRQTIEDHLVDIKTVVK